MRKVKFENGKYYHVFNRGVDKREIFSDDKDYLRFLTMLRIFNNESTKEQREYALKMESNSGYPELDSFLSPLPKFVEIIAYCLNPNHYHMLLKQLKENGVTKFMHKLGTGYTNYFNKKYNRSGALFQGRYKSKEIKTDAQFWYVSAYINGNPEIHKIAKADKWLWSSYLDYLNKRNGTLCNKKVILGEFKNIKNYQEYIREVIKSSREIKEELKQLQFEEQ